MLPLFFGFFVLPAVALAQSHCTIDGGGSDIPLTTPLDEVSVMVSLTCNGTLAGPTGPITAMIPDPEARKYIRMDLVQNKASDSAPTIATLTFSCYAEADATQTLVEILLMDSKGKEYRTMYTVKAHLDVTFPKTTFVSPPTPVAIADNEREAPVYGATMSSAAAGQVQVANEDGDPRLGVALSFVWMRTFNNKTKELHTLHDPTPKDPNWPKGLKVSHDSPLKISWSLDYDADLEGLLVTLGFDRSDKAHLYPRAYVAAQVLAESEKPGPCVAEDDSEVQATLGFGDTIDFSLRAICPPGNRIYSWSNSVGDILYRTIGAVTLDGNFMKGKYSLYGNAIGYNKVQIQYEMKDLYNDTLTRNLVMKFADVDKADIPKKIAITSPFKAQDQSNQIESEKNLELTDEDFELKFSMALDGGGVIDPVRNAELTATSVTKAVSGSTQSITSPEAGFSLFRGIKFASSTLTTATFKIQPKELEEPTTFMVCVAPKEAYYSYSDVCNTVSVGVTESPSSSPGADAGKGKKKGMPKWAVGLIVSAVLLVVVAVVAVVVTRKNGSQLPKHSGLLNDDAGYAALDA